MGESVQQTPTPPRADRGHEHSDVPIRPLLIFLAGLTVMLVLVSGIIAGLFYVFEASAAKSDPEASPLVEQDPATPGPLLQVSPREDLEILRKRDLKALNTPAWIDRERGVARIPIEQAIAQVAERGLPEWPAVETEAAQADAGASTPEVPAARTSAGTGLTTPVEEGAEP